MTTELGLAQDAFITVPYPWQQWISKGFNDTWRDVMSGLCYWHDKVRRRLQVTAAAVWDIAETTKTELTGKHSVTTAASGLFGLSSQQMSFFAPLTLTLVKLNHTTELCRGQCPETRPGAVPIATNQPQLYHAAALCCLQESVRPSVTILYCV